VKELEDYVYLSDAKIDALFDQIPSSLLNKFTGEFGIELGVLTAKVSGGSNRKNRYQRLEAVRRYLDGDGRIGSLDSGKPYVSATLKMRFGRYENSGMVYFTGVCRSVDAGRTIIVGLGGSLKHMTGSEHVEAVSAGHSGSASIGMNADFFTEQLKINIEPLLEKVRQDSAEESQGASDVSYIGEYIVESHQRIRGFEQEVEFVARRLQQGRINDKIAILGTPLYVRRKS
jgi:hypothetical protein